MGLEKMPSGRRTETSGEDEVCPNCQGKGTTGNSPDTIRMCKRCDSKGKIGRPGL
jgi:hypothetical protein